MVASARAGSESGTSRTPPVGAVALRADESVSPRGLRGSSFLSTSESCLDTNLCAASLVNVRSEISRTCALIAGMSSGVSFDLGLPISSLPSTQKTRPTFSQSSGFAPESNPPSPECLLHLAFSSASLSFLVEPRCLCPYRARTDGYEAVTLVFLGLGEERKGFGNTQRCLCVPTGSRYVAGLKILVSSVRFTPCRPMKSSFLSIVDVELGTLTAIFNRHQPENAPRQNCMLV